MDQKNNLRAPSFMEMILGGSTSLAAKVAAMILLAGTLSLLASVASVDDSDRMNMAATRSSLASAPVERPVDHTQIGRHGDCREAESQTQDRPPHEPAH